MHQLITTFEDSSSRVFISILNHLLLCFHEMCIFSFIETEGAKLTKKQRAKWLTVITNEFMSLEKSDLDDKITLYQPQWRKYVTKMFEQIDKYTNSFESPQARQQMKKRNVDATSDRSLPKDAPPWAVKA